jgi:hypothetical protein
MALWPRISNKNRLVGRYSDSATFIIAIIIWVSINTYRAADGQFQQMVLRERGGRGGGGSKSHFPVKFSLIHISQLFFDRIRVPTVKLKIPDQVVHLCGDRNAMLYLQLVCLVIDTRYDVIS